MNLSNIASKQWEVVVDPSKDTWSEADKLEWLSKQKFQRNYAEQVLVRIEKLKQAGDPIKIQSYGNLSLQSRNELVIDGTTLNAEEYRIRYPLYYAEVGDITNGKPNIIGANG